MVKRVKPLNILSRKVRRKKTRWSKYQHWIIKIRQGKLHQNMCKRVCLHKSDQITSGETRSCTNIYMYIDKTHTNTYTQPNHTSNPFKLTVINIRTIERSSFTCYERWRMCRLFWQIWTLRELPLLDFLVTGVVPLALLRWQVPFQRRLRWTSLGVLP